MYKYLTTDLMLVFWPASKWSFICWQQQQCCLNCNFLLRLLQFVIFNLRLRVRFTIFCRSKKKLPRHKRSKNARPSVGPLPRGVFVEINVDIIICHVIFILSCYFKYYLFINVAIFSILFSYFSIEINWSGWTNKCW